jgi:shikimate kinase/3-dehydroquinate synthase
VAGVSTERRGGSEPGGVAGRRKLVFVGFMGAGKSRAARRAAERLGAEALDTDKLLEAELGESIASFFEREGEAAFREREEALVLSALERSPSVLSLGGGALKSERVRERLEPHVCVYVDVDPDLAWERSQDSGRPLARDRDAFLRLHAERRPLYESVARAALQARPEGVEQGALEAAIALADPGAPVSVRMVWAPASSGGYPVYIGAGALDAAGVLWPLSGRCFIVADETVHALHGDRLARALAVGPVAANTLTVAPGERQKSLAEAERILRALARAGMERSDALAALGGGVLGDLAGFCGALYQRGVPLVHVPTTVVAQVDSAYGGKTGVDLPEGKNYVGAFHQPSAVFTDPGLLSTLPVEELRAGYAEVLKTALIAGGPLSERVRRLEPLERVIELEPDRLREVIEGCLRVKIGVVAEDERDHGVRASLNLGHTFAHALEAATAYSAYRHGEAVAIGLVVALRLSERKLGLDQAVREEVVTLLRENELPTTFSGAPTEDLLAVAARDKKRRGGASNFVLLRSPGDVATECDVSEQELSAVIEEVREL